MTAESPSGLVESLIDDRPLKVLVIEDNELNRKLFRDLLAANGYVVLATGDGEDGYRMARAEQPALIVLDIQLPGASGLDVVGWIKNDAATREIPVIAVTALAMQGDEQRVLAAGCDAYVAKPISCGDFLKTVARFLS
ncbi:MAG: response regulator [Alphaproteobacteria bacterium]